MNAKWNVPLVELLFYCIATISKYLPEKKCLRIFDENTWFFLQSQPKPFITYLENYSGLADHHAPLYARPWDVSKRDIGDTGSPNVDKSVQWLISQGM